MCPHSILLNNNVSKWAPGLLGAHYNINRKMKKIRINMGMTAMAMMLVAVFASCDTKQCRCYEYVGNRWIGPTTTNTYSGNRCDDLNTKTYFCNEMDDPILDPSDIAVGKKKK